MATGKELVRMMTCGIWKEQVRKRKDFCSAYICNSKGNQITMKKAKTETFCFARILFRDCPEDSLNILAELLRTVASTRSESMNKYTNEYYGFQEIIIS